MKKLRILFLLQTSSTVLRGGSEIQADLIINKLLSRRHEIYFVSDLIGTPKKGIRNVKYLYLKNYGRQYSILNFFPLIKTLKNINPDIIYQRWRIPYTAMAAWYSKKYSKKMIFHIARDLDTRKKKIKLNYMSFFNFINEHFERYGIRNADIIIAQTNNQQKLIKKHFNRNSLVVPNGHLVPPPPFKKINPPVIAWIANIKPWKQPEIFIKLAEHLQNTKAQFIYAGRPIKGKLQKRLMEKTRKLPNLEYLGEIPFEKTNELLSKSSLFVNTSLPLEGFPNTYIQAWMRETPVVALNCDPDNLLKRLKIGLLSGSFKQMIDDLRYLIENENIRKEMGKRARQYAIQNHDIEKIDYKYLDVFEMAINL